MNEPTLNPYMTKLSKKQQEYIVYCVRAFGDMPDFHRGLLPFLKLQTASNCVKVKLERLMEISPPLLPGEKQIPVVGVKFIRQLLSMFEGALPHKLYPDEQSVVMYVSDNRLGYSFGRRYGPTFCFSMKQWKADQMVKLEKLGKDQWRVTTAKGMLDDATTYLATYYR